ncbi:DNA recombination protein RmuC [Corynebacterium sanguinis]|uniref:DNA recombination protein RmuC n=1 Tax=Corynebacterium sanguinis TaxID=2594913 RepID=A0A6C1U021_9CORY|nr:DNA recombination protein RmuC [Corynebacterium sanguinis]MBA4503898.1 DNA recombination protein RmuC [Corynebacterium sanguinis]MCT1498965.1 DNA recombination protein RmuC [Corynebacterium sanguinis]MCT1882837.1 DNA recombination protein RmuC [Corynebacterium sanguinis]TVS29112.1 DNA recombination protein RmuC [Corynebacterium sanguinis]
MQVATVLVIFALGVILGAALTYLLARRQSPQPQQTLDIRPVSHELERLRTQLDEMDADRAVAMSALASQVQTITRTSTRLTDRTDQLISALRSPQTRGRWGEVQLQRVVELGGMVEHCDFDVQATELVDGTRVRPDMIIRLSAGRNIVVDAKVPFSSYLDALNTDDPEEKQAYLRRHAHLLHSHVDTLSAKSYIAAFQPAPEFVVMFVPADPFLDAALALDPEMLEYAFARDVVIATPTTLFALLRTVALGWRHEAATEQARQIQRLGAQLYQRLGTMAEHYNRVGQSLERAVDAFNSTLASMDSRVMVTARKFEEMGVVSPKRSTSHAVDAVSATPRHAAEPE